MKYLTIIYTFLFLSTSVYASKLVKCIAKEEAYFHKSHQQKSGPLYKLNQSLISELIQLPDTVQVNKKLLVELCDNKTLFKSPLLIEKLVRTPNIFTSNIKNKQLSSAALDRMAINRLQAKSYSLILEFILNTQTLASDPKCIYRKVPELNSLMNKVKYVQEDIGIAKIFKEIEDKNKFYLNIFSPNILEGCQN